MGKKIVLAKVKFPPIKALNFAGVSVNRCLGTWDGWQPATLSAYGRLKPECDGDAPLGAVLLPLMELMWQKPHAMPLVACTHHDSVAYLAPVLSNEFVIVQADYTVMWTDLRGHV